MPLQLILILILSLFLVLFTFQNPHPVQMHFMAWGPREFPLIAIILISVLGGVIISTMLSIKSTSSLKKMIRDLETELNQIKTPSPVPEEEGPK